MADDETKDGPKKRPMKRVTINCPATGAKVFTSMGTLGNGACVSLPEGEARRYIELGLARLTEETKDSKGADVTIIGDRAVSP